MTSSVVQGIRENIKDGGPLLIADNIHKSYGDLAVLRGVSIRLEQASVNALVGSSGAGKSTLLHILGALDSPSKGEVHLGKVNYAGLRPKELAFLRNKLLGFVFQFHHLLPEFTALENAAMPALIAGLSMKKAKDLAAELLTQLGLADRLEHKPSALSGGEQQRVAIARAMINKPLLILADEPTGNLDSANSELLYGLFHKLAKEYSVSFLIATHDKNLAEKTEKTFLIQDGLLLP